MHLENQLKRGYLALLGIILLVFAAIATPEFSSQENALAFSSEARDICLANAKSNWKLASTPIDIQPILIRKAMICQA